MTDLHQRAKTNEAELGQHLPLTRRLLAYESGARQGAVDTVEAAEVVCRKLSGHLGKRIGQAGFGSLLARALHLSKRRFPFLEGVEVEPQGEVCLGGVRDLVVSRDAAEVGEGLATLFASLLFLLGQFIGEDMALRQIARLWPEVPVLDASPGPKEMEE